MPVHSDAGSRVALAALVPHSMPGGSVPGVRLAPPPSLSLCLRDPGFGTRRLSVTVPAKATTGVRSAVPPAMADVRAFSTGIPCIPAHV